MALIDLVHFWFDVADDAMRNDVEERRADFFAAFRSTTFAVVGQRDRVGKETLLNDVIVNDVIILVAALDVSLLRRRLLRRRLLQRRATEQTSDRRLIVFDLFDVGFLDDIVTATFRE